MDSDIPQEALVKEQDVLRFLSTPRSTGERDLFQLHQHPIVRGIFLKYNTPITSSGPVERLFSYAGKFEKKMYKHFHRIISIHFLSLQV